MKTIYTPNAPEPAGHYSQGIVNNGIVYVSGQLPIDPMTGEKKTGPIEEQVEQALRNVEEVLKAAGSGLNKVIKATVYVSDIALWPKVNEAYAKLFGSHKPARVVVPTRELHYGFKVEIEVMAEV